MKVRRRIAAVSGLAIVVAAVTVGSIVASGGIAGARTATNKAAVPTTASFDLAVSVATTSTTYAGSIVGQVNLATGQVAGTLNIPEGFGTIISAIAPKFASLVPAAVSADTSAQVVFSGQTIYLSLAGFSLGGKQWIGIPFALPKGITPALKTVAKGLENVKNLARLEHRLGVSSTSLGTKTINGVTAQGYSASVGLASILRLVPHLHGHTKSGINSTAVGTAIPIQVWAEHAGPVVQVTIDVNPPASSGINSVDISLGLSNWGAPVTITAPPASEVFTIPFSL